VERGRLIYAVDLGGTNLRAGLVDPSGRVVASVKTPPRGDRRPAVLLRTLTELLERLVAEAGGRPDALALAVPGPMDLGRGRVATPVNLPDLGETPLVEVVTAEFGLPVTMVNDATAFVLGEYWRGAARGHPYCLGVTLGTGVGGGAVLDGRPLLGVKGNALEIGHLTVEPGGRPCNCGRRGCLEVYASASAVRRRAMELAREGKLPDLLAAAGGDPVQINSRLVTEHARGGDRLCLDLLEEVGRYLGRGLALAVTLLDVDLAVVGGGLAGAGELILGPAREALERHRFRTPTAVGVVTGELGGDAGLIGAAALVYGAADLAGGLF
jgi:glucokinase